MNKCASLAQTLTSFNKEQLHTISVNLADTSIPSKIFEEATTLIALANRFPRHLFNLNLSGKRRIQRKPCLALARSFNLSTNQSAIHKSWIVELNEVEFSDSDSFFQLLNVLLIHRSRDAIQNYTLSLSPESQKNPFIRNAILLYQKYLLEVKG